MIFKKRISLKIAAIIVIVEIIAMTALYFTVDHYLTEILEKRSIWAMSIIARDRAQLVEMKKSTLVQSENTLNF